MRIAALSEAELTNSNYRSYQPIHALERRGHEIRVNERDKPIRAEELTRVEVVHIHRIISPELQQIVRGLHESGIGLVWDNDDDVTAVPKSNPLYAKHGGIKGRERRAAIRSILRFADVVTTPSEVLAAQYRELGATDVRVLENYLPPRAAVGSTRHQGIVIACLAALEHQVDYQQLGLRETLQQLLDAHPDLRVMSIGLGHGLPAERCEHIPLVPFLELARTLSRADIGIAPLIDIPWNRARSNIKLKEYSSGALPWLASPVGPYLDMGEEQGGRLVPDDGWHAALERLIVDKRDRRKLAKRALKWGREQTVSANVRVWEDALQAAVERVRQRA